MALWKRNVLDRLVLIEQDAKHAKTPEELEALRAMYREIRALIEAQGLCSRCKGCSEAFARFTHVNDGWCLRCGGLGLEPPTGFNTEPTTTIRRLGREHPQRPAENPNHTRPACDVAEWENETLRENSDDGRDPTLGWDGEWDEPGYTDQILAEEKALTRGMSQDGEWFR